MLAAGEGDLGEGYLFCFLEGLADDGEGLRLGVVFGDDEVGFFEVLGINIGGVDELGYLHGVLGGDAELIEFPGFDGDVLALAVLVAFDDFVLFDNGGGALWGVVVALGGLRGGVFEGGGEDFLVADALAGGAGDLVEGGSRTWLRWRRRA